MKLLMNLTSGGAASSHLKPPSLLHASQKLHVSRHHQLTILYRPILIAAILCGIAFVLPHLLDLAFRHPLVIRIRILCLLIIEVECQ